MRFALALALLPLAACQKPDPAAPAAADTTAAAPATAPADTTATSTGAPAPAAAAAPVADAEVLAALPAGVSPEPATSLVGVWECPSGVPAAHVTLEQGGRYLLMAGTEDEMVGSWTLGPGTLSLEGPEGTVAYTGVAVGPDDFAGRNDGTLFTCSRLPM